MKKGDKTRKIHDLVYHIANTITEDLKNDKKAVADALRDDGLDYNTVRAEGLDFIKSVKIESRRKWAQDKKERVLKLIEQVKQTRDKLMDRANILDQLSREFSGPEAVAYFQKITSLEDDDLQNILDESAVLRLLDEESRMEENDDEGA